MLSASRPDSSTFGKLYRLADECLTMAGADSPDVQTARYVALQLERLGSKYRDSLANGLSNLLTAKLYRELGNAEQGRPFAANAVRLLETYGDEDLQAQANIELGGSYSNERADLPQKIMWYRRAASLYKRLGATLQEAHIKEFLGDLMQLNDEYAASIQVLQDCLKLYVAVGYDRLHGVYSLLGRGYQGINNFAESLHHNLIAMQIAEKLGDNGALMVAIYNRIGRNYSNVRNHIDALTYFDKALRLAIHNTDTPAIKLVLMNKVVSYQLLDKPEECLATLHAITPYGAVTHGLQKIEYETMHIYCARSLGRMSEAAPHFRKLLEYLQSPATALINKQVIRLHIASYLQQAGRYAESLPYLQTYYRYTDSVAAVLITRSEAALLSYRIDSANGQYAQALTHYRDYKKLTDSLNSNVIQQQMAALKVQYETSEKDRNIQQLTQKAQLQEASLIEERLYRYLFIAGVCILTAFLALIYNRYRTKRKTAAQLEEKQVEINQQNERLQRLVVEKEWLLKEVHHRVKNNLQIVISLLNTQSRYLEHEDAIGAIRNSQQRMYSMSLIHQRLYQTDNIGRIDMGWYIVELTQYLKDSFEAGDRIRIITDVDDISLVVTQAVPMGLMVNEAVSNAIKYAFPDGRRGCIRISLKNDGQQQGVLIISDDGVGVPDVEEMAGKESLGMSLMHGLAEQLGGELTLRSDENGLSIATQFSFRSITDEPLPSEN